MSNTNDHINRGETINAVYRRIKQIGYDNNPDVLSIRQAVREVPAIDVIEVMRCKDCKYNKEHHPFNGKERITVFWCEMENRNARHNDNPDWFCADWKKKDK